MAKATAAAPKANVELYDALVATQAQIERKGAKMPYTSVNGHMFSFLAADGTMGLRLPAEAREAFVEKYRTCLCEQNGRIMKEYVTVPASLLKKTADLSVYFELSYAYVAALKPKPTAKKRS